MPTVFGIDRMVNPAVAAAPFYNTVFGTPTLVDGASVPTRTLGLTASMAIDSPGNEGIRQLISTGTPAKGWVGFGFRVDALPAGADTTLLTIADLANTAKISLTSAGTLYSFVTGGGTQSMAAAVVANTWYWVEAIFDSNDGTGTKKLYWRVAGTDQTTATLVQVASTMDYAQMLSFAGEGTGTWNVGGWAWGSASSGTDWQTDNLFPGPSMDLTAFPKHVLRPKVAT